MNPSKRSLQFSLIGSPSDYVAGDDRAYDVLSRGLSIGIVEPGWRPNAIPEAEPVRCWDFRSCDGTKSGQGATRADAVLDAYAEPEPKSAPGTCGQQDPSGNYRCRLDVGHLPADRHLWPELWSVRLVELDGRRVFALCRPEDDSPRHYLGYGTPYEEAIERAKEILGSWVRPRTPVEVIPDENRPADRRTVIVCEVAA